MTVDPQTPPASPGVTGEELLGMPAWQLDTPPPPTLGEGWERSAEAPAAAGPPRTVLPGPIEPMEEPPPPERILEALLFVGGPPLTARRAAEAIRGLTPPEFQTAIDGLARAYRTQGRPYHIQPQGDGYVLNLRQRFAVVRERLQGGIREARLSQAAVDVLALVAYRQPATRQDIDALRGAASASILRLLVRHGLVAVSQDEGETRFVTTARFLELFGLRNLEDLPQTQDLQRI